MGRVDGCGARGRVASLPERWGHYEAQTRWFAPSVAGRFPIHRGLVQPDARERRDAEQRQGLHRDGVRDRHPRGGPRHQRPDADPARGGRPRLPRGERPLPRPLDPGSAVRGAPGCGPPGVLRPGPGARGDPRVPHGSARGRGAGPGAGDRPVHRHRREHRPAIEVGDSRWRSLVELHHAAVRRELARFRGHEIDTAGDGFFARFDGPARAIRCARAIVEAVAPLGLRFGRACTPASSRSPPGGGLRGLAVHIGARVGGIAGAGEILVSQTVRDLVAGSGLELVDRGVHTVEGRARRVAGLRRRVTRVRDRGPSWTRSSSGRRPSAESASSRLGQGLGVATSSV